MKIPRRTEPARDCFFCTMGLETQRGFGLFQCCSQKFGVVLGLIDRRLERSFLDYAQFRPVDDLVDFFQVKPVGAEQRGGLCR